MDYGPYNLWNGGQPEKLRLLTTNESSPWAIRDCDDNDSSCWSIRGSDDNGTVVNKELIDTIAKEVVEQIRNEHNEVKFVWDKEKYYIKHR